MKIDDLNWLRQLDPQQTYGTLQGLLLSGDMTSVPFEKACKYLIKQMMQEREQMLKENKKMFDLLKSNNLAEKILED
jgi:hypothetical protein